MTHAAEALTTMAAIAGAIYAPPDVLTGVCVMAMILGLIFRLNLEEPD